MTETHTFSLAKENIRVRKKQKGVLRYIQKGQIREKIYFRNTFLHFILVINKAILQNKNQLILKKVK